MKNWFTRLWSSVFDAEQPQNTETQGSESNLDWKIQNLSDKRIQIETLLKQVDIYEDRMKKGLPIDKKEYMDLVKKVLVLKSLPTHVKVNFISSKKDETS